MMAHEVNNTIGPVNSILQTTIKNQSLWQNTGLETLQDALKIAMERNHNLNSFMRNFADVVRLPAPARKNVDLVRLLRSTVTLMKLRAGEKQIDFEFDFKTESFLSMPMNSSWNRH